MRFETPRRVMGVVCACALATTMTATRVSAATIAVPAGGDLQAAINAAQAGDVITLAAGATYSGNFVLPDKGAITAPIVIRSATPDSQLPNPGVRITPAFAALLAKLKSPNSLPALRTATAAHHWTLMLLEFQANLNGYGDLIQLGAGDSTQSQLSQVPYKLLVDRVYIHGDPRLGQKRGIALNSSDTTIKNSYISDCKAIGQDSQAIMGFNGPGTYLIENNYLEGAAENVLFGGADPVIPNLVPSNIVVRGNQFSKPVEWRAAIIATPTRVLATPIAGGGMLAAGTYSYVVVARRAAGQTNKATSNPAAEAAATLGAMGGVTISWAAVADADDYLVFGRTSGGQIMYWKTTSLFLTDSGDVGTAGTVPANGTKWAVKNTFELKNAQDVTVEGNVFENMWMADQAGFPFTLTPRNQGGNAPWSVVQRVTIRNNLVRHTAGGFNILGHDDAYPSQQTNHLTIQNNVFQDMNGAVWGSGSRFVQMGAGVDSIVIDHNTIDTTTANILWLYGGSVSAPTPDTNVKFTNNMSPHSFYGIMGDSYGVGLSSINAYLPGSQIVANVLAGGRASLYPGGNFFPTVAEWQAQFVDFVGGNYRLAASSAYKNAGIDGKDLGADVDVVESQVANALSGDNSLPAGTVRVQILTNSLPNGTYGQPYAQSLACSGGSSPCAWSLQSSSIAPGLSFDSVAAIISGTPTGVGVSSLTVQAWDPAAPANYAVKPFSFTIAPPPFVVNVTPASSAQVGVPYQLTPSTTGAMGTVAWSVGSGIIAAGLGVDPVTGTISGVPSAWSASTSFVLQAQDDFAVGRTATAPVTMTVAPAPLAITQSTLPGGAYNTAYGVLLRTTGGTGAAAWSLTGGVLPTGLRLDASGALSGTPTSTGTFTFAVKATDAVWPGYEANAALTLNISAPVLMVIVPAPPAGRVGQPYELTASATGAMGAVTWSLASGSLPGGLLLNPATGTIAGVPSAAGTFPITLRATDGARSATAPATISVALPIVAGAPPVSEVVLYASKASPVVGTWSKIADATAAGGYLLATPNAGAAKLTTPLAAPTSYFELTFRADANTPYHLWVRGKAEGDGYQNDSVYVQYSQSVNSVGAAINRIGTTTASPVSIEDGSGGGLSGWGWQDDAYGAFAAPVYFAASGTQTIRVQLREDGVSLDQIVLSSAKYLTAAPGAAKNDDVILSETASAITAREIVLYASAPSALAGSWSKVVDGSAAAGLRLYSPNAGAPKLTTPLAAPADYFELTFKADAGVPYHLWIRGKADADGYENDSVYVQYSQSVTPTGEAINRIGTSSAAKVSIEDGVNAGLSGWGWQDDAYGTMAPPVYFATSGVQTIRVQVREDGISIDQIVLSASKYLTAAPGAAKDDTVILIP